MLQCSTSNINQPWFVALGLTFHTQSAAATEIFILYHTTWILKCCFKPTHKKKTWFIQWSACSIHFHPHQILLLHIWCGKPYVTNIHLGMAKKRSLALDDTSPLKPPCVLAKSPWNDNEPPHFCRYPLTAPWFLPSFHAIQSCFAAAAQAVANSVAHNHSRIRHQATCPTPADAQWHWVMFGKKTMWGFVPSNLLIPWCFRVSST